MFEANEKVLAREVNELVASREHARTLADLSKIALAPIVSMLLCFRFYSSFIFHDLCPLAQDESYIFLPKNEMSETSNNRRLLATDLPGFPGQL